MAAISRNVRLFAIHGRVNGEPMDYFAFFDAISRRDPRERVVALTTDLSIGLERIRVDGTIFSMRFVAGNPEEAPLFFDPTTGRSEQGNAPRGTWLSSATRVVIDAHPEARLVAIEGRQKGISASTLERFFRIGARDWRLAPRVSVEINPVPSESFVLEIDRFERIRLASVVVTRPNVDWDDESDYLSELAAESGGHVAEAQIRAARGESLERKRGIVGFLRRIGSGKRPTHVSDAKITGIKEGEATESTVSLQKHQVTTKARIERGTNESMQDDTIWSRGQSLIVQFLERNPERSEASEEADGVQERHHE